MKQTKFLTIIVGVFLIGVLSSGVVSANREISDMQGIDIENFIAGTEVTANFSYYYLERGENVNNSPWILQFNISSLNENYPVWKEDFEMSGYIERCKYDIGTGSAGWCLLGTEIIPFECSEVSNQTIEHPLGSESVTAENGTFYCYNHTTDLDLKRYDNVFLNIKSHVALYPGNYELSAKLFYLNDTYPPIVNILNKDDFENTYYKSGNNSEVRVSVADVNLDESEMWGKIYWNGHETLLNKNKVDGLYYFSKTLPDEIPEGNHTIEIFARDIFGNSATDETRLLIDEIPPEIKLVEPTNPVVSNLFTIKFNVTDEKAGVNNESVQVRLREIINNITICPETGGSIGNFSCTTTPWINLVLNETSGLFEKEINAPELNLSSNEYWLDAVASDILGNKRKWIA